ncbi:hypothetical protein CFP56_016365 [Quercus suber]|uniref:Uncharacterized protein n=1 Tax=Quercus suber TaxID=58331 RepID=A0AAW0KMW5_QUESU
MPFRLHDVSFIYQKPSLMSEVSGIAKQRVDHKRILYVDTRFKPAYVKGNISQSALFDACALAKELKKLGTRKWEVTSKVRVELLSYAASRSRGNGQVQQLSKGGELLTFVWQLMAQFGLRESWVENRISTRLIVNI